MPHAKKLFCSHQRWKNFEKPRCCIYGVSAASISNWVSAYREECQINDEEKSQLELMEEVRRLRQEKAEQEKEKDF